ncbi:MAG: Rieske 2Fe-2S domain-containing protein [Candidatus Binatia bacterium]
MARQRQSANRKAAGKWHALVEPTRVHRAIYVDPAIFEEEMTKIFGGTWVYLAHESEVPQPYAFRLGALGVRPLVITRDGEGRLHALFNRCMHRGATVCRAERGSARTFMCGYHGWTYDSTGKLVGVPYPKAYGPRFDRSELALREVPRVESYRGFIFGTLNLDAPSLIEHLGAARPLLDRWMDRFPGPILVRNGAHRMAYRGNWKLAFDNAADAYHPPVSHSSIQEMTTRRYGFGRSLSHFAGDPDDGAMYVQGLGNGHTFLDQRPAMGDSLWEQDRPIPGGEAFVASLRRQYGDAEAARLLEFAVGGGMNLNIFPNLLIIGNQIQVIEPLSVDRTQLTWYATTVENVPAEINTLRMRMQEDFPNFGEPDDQANFEECQRGLAVPEIEWLDLSRHSETGRERVDDRGVVTGPVTDEITLRSYLQEWRRLMAAEVSLATGPNATASARALAAVPRPAPEAR